MDSQDGGDNGHEHITADRNEQMPIWMASIRHISIVALLFIVAGVAEIGGGWLVWKAIREPETLHSKSTIFRVLMAAGGALMLAGYGFIVTLQPLDDFGRLFAAYGGVFIGMSLSWAALFDDFRPDRYDIIGSCIAVIGAAIILFAPRGGDTNDNAHETPANFAYSPL